MEPVQESSMKVARLVFPASAVPSDVGDRVSRERRRVGWTQARLAVRSGLSRAAVYRLEGGSLPVRADTLFRIAHALDLPIRELVPDWPEWDPIKGHGHGEGVRKRPRAIGLTMAELADMVGVSEATLSRHERSVGVSGAFLVREGDEIVSRDDRLSDALDRAAATLKLRT